MSGMLAGKVWHSALPAHLKPLAAALADEARDDGTQIHPSMALIEWKLGASRSGVKANMQALRKLGVLRAVCHAECQDNPGGPHGRGQPVHYLLDEDALPKRAPWAEERERLQALREKGPQSGPFEPERVQPEIEKGPAEGLKGSSSTCDDPYSVDPSEIIDPDQTPPPLALRVVSAIGPTLHIGQERMQPRGGRAGVPATGTLVPIGLDSHLNEAYAGLAQLVAELCGWLAPSASVSDQLLAWARDLSPEDVLRIRRECQEAVASDRSGRRGNAWALVKAVAGRVYAARKSGRDPWAEPRPAAPSSRRPANAMPPSPAHTKAIEGVAVVGFTSDGRTVRRRDVARGHLEDGSPIPAELTS